MNIEITLKRNSLIKFSKNNYEIFIFLRNSRDQKKFQVIKF